MNTSLRSFIASALATTLLAFSAGSYADDTEIYFARANVDNAENKPTANVLFLLDTSGSMAGSRMRDLRSAFATVVNSVDENINIGVAKFNEYTQGSTQGYGGYVFYPVTPMTEDNKSEVTGLVNSLQDPSNYSLTPTFEAYTEAVRYMLGDSVGPYPKAQDATWDNPRKSVHCQQAGSNCNRDATYTSPINFNNQCESNHIIVMTDGAPYESYDSDNSSRDYARSKTGSNSRCSANSGSDHSYPCQEELAEWLYNDGNDTQSRKSIKTWQIGFQMDDSALASMDKVAKLGGTEEVRRAEDADDLAAAFLEILDLIDDESRSISAPGIAVNTMNRFQHLDELYYAVFQPADSSYWEGNLKKYRLIDQEIRGQNGAAIDPTTGYFKPDARSYWSSEVDGADAQKGGARENVGARKLFYSTASGDTKSVNWDSTPNQEPTNAFFGLSTNADPGNAEREALFTRLKTMWGDPMHSVPLMVNYGGDDNYVFVSTNGGMLHIIDTSDGSEAAAFMPHELFQKATSFATNRPPLQDNTRQLYGLDASWTAWRKPGETVAAKPEAVYLYGGMRRGGKHFYALDVTNPASPELKWQIDAGDAGFERLGQTWSTPTLIRMPTASGSVPALVFGGGYSPEDHDNHQGRKSEDAMGNTVYVVNAETGALIWSATHADMKWAIPGGISVVDMDFDGVADFFYFADLGGQVFRAKLNPSGTGHSVQRIAELGGSGSDHRRFYEAPAVAYVKEGVENHFYVAVASGYRAHPLDEDTNEGLFVIADKDAMGTGTSAEAKIANMANVALGQTFDLDNHRGWYYLFEADSGRPGEKALSSPTIFDNKIMVSTYAPTVDQEYDNPCAVRYGAAYLHTVNLRTGAPASLSKDAPEPLSRSEKLEQSTPPPTPTIIIDEDGNIVVVVGTEVIGDDELGDPNLRKRRWMQLPKDEAGVIKTNAGKEE